MSRDYRIDLKTGERFCAHCGAPIRKPEPKPEPQPEYPPDHPAPGDLGTVPL